MYVGLELQALYEINDINSEHCLIFQYQFIKYGSTSPHTSPQKMEGIFAGIHDAILCNISWLHV